MFKLAERKQPDIQHLIFHGFTDAANMFLSFVDLAVVRKVEVDCVWSAQSAVLHESFVQDRVHHCPRALGYCSQGHILARINTSPYSVSITPCGSLCSNSRQ